MDDSLFKINNWRRTPSVYELDAANVLDESRPAFEQIQLYSLTRGATGEKLKEYWQSFLRRFRKLEPKEILVDHQPVWVPLLDLHVPAAGKGSVTYTQSGSHETGPELKILGSGFGGTLSAELSESLSFNAEDIGKSFQMKILVTATHYASDEGDDQIRLEPELPPSSPEYRIEDLPAALPPAALDSPQWQILHRVNLSNAQKGTYTWQRERTVQASWKVDAGIPIPEALGITANWTLEISRSEAFSVKYEIPYGREYVFYQPTGEVLLTPFCVVRSNPV